MCYYTLLLLLPRFYCCCCCYCSATALLLLCYCRFVQLLCCFAVAAAAHAVRLTEQVGIGYIIMSFLLVRHRAPLPRLMCQGQPRACTMCYCGCSCRCSAAALVPLLCTCYYCPVLLLLLLCLRIFFVAIPRENGYYASHPLSEMCLPILKLKDGSICFGSCQVPSCN